MQKAAPTPTTYKATTTRSSAVTWDRVTRVLNYTSGGFFLLAMVLSVVFISINLEKGSAMKDDNTQRPDGYTELLKKGLRCRRCSRCSARPRSRIRASRPLPLRPQANRSA